MHCWVISQGSIQPCCGGPGLSRLAGTPGSVLAVLLLEAWRCPSVPLGQEGLQGEHSTSHSRSFSRTAVGGQPWGWGGGRTCRIPTVPFLSSSWQINPGLEILVQQSTVRTWHGGATLQRQSLGKWKTNTGLCKALNLGQGPTYVMGGEGHLQQGVGVSPV